MEKYVRDREQTVSAKTLLTKTQTCYHCTFPEPATSTINSFENKTCYSRSTWTTVDDTQYLAISSHLDGIQNWPSYSYRNIPDDLINVNFILPWWQQHKHTRYVTKNIKCTHTQWNITLDESKRWPTICWNMYATVRSWTPVSYTSAKNI